MLKNTSSSQKRSSQRPEEAGIQQQQQQDGNMVDRVTPTAARQEAWGMQRWHFGRKNSCFQPKARTSKKRHDKMLAETAAASRKIGHNSAWEKATKEELAMTTQFDSSMTLLLQSEWCEATSCPSRKQQMGSSTLSSS